MTTDSEVIGAAIMPERLTARRIALALCFYIAATFVFLYPLPFHLGDRIFENGDSYVHLWIFGWEDHILRHSPSDFWDGNIFFPEGNSLALSELVLPDLLIFSPVLRITQNPLVAYNFTLLATFPLSALSMLILVFYLTRRFSAALIAGFIFGFTPIRLAHLLHVQLESLMWLPLLFLFFHRWLKERRWRDAAIVSVLFVIQYLTTVYLALYLVPALLALFVFNAIVQKDLSKQLLLQGLSAAALALGMLSPIVIPYRQLQQWNVAPAESLKIFYSSDLWLNLLAVFPSNWIYGTLFRSFTAAPYERFYFSGFVFIALLIVAVRRWRDSLTQSFLVVAVTSYVIAMGPYLQVSGHVTALSLPYRWVMDSLPGFSMLRVPARAGLITFAALTVLAAFGWLRFWEWVSPRTRMSEWQMAGAMVLLLGMEFFSAPVPLLPEVSGSRIPQVYTFLRDSNEQGGILELPTFGRESDGTEFWERIYTYFSAYHFKPTVMGYSGYYPPNFHELIAASLELPSDKSLDLFEAIGVRGIVLHTKRLSGAKVEAWDKAIALARRLERVVSYPDGSQYVALKPVLRISQDLNSLDWKLQCGPLQTDGTVSVTLSAEKLHAEDWDYVVNPQLPRPPERAANRVRSTRVKAEWRDADARVVLEHHLEIRLPYILNNAVVTMKIAAPKTAGLYSINIQVLESPTLSASAQALLR